MSNRSHRNAGHIGMNRLRKAGLLHSSARAAPAMQATATTHIVAVARRCGKFPTARSSS